MKTPYNPAHATLAANPFNRLRWNLNEVEGKWDAAVRAMLNISQCKDLNDARRIATETLVIMSRTTERQPQ